jgi:uncharacterized membrane protein (DUF2068 family)
MIRKPIQIRVFAFSETTDTAYAGAAGGAVIAGATTTRALNTGFEVRLPSMVKPYNGNRAVVVIGVFKLLTGISLLTVALGILRLLHRDVGHMILNVINWFRVDPENRYVAALLAKMGLVDDHHLKELVGLAAIYAVLYLIEGTGLMLRKRWAEYVTVIVTGSFVPMEIYEIVHHCNLAKVLLLAINVLIVAYLVWHLRRERAQAR